jgi:hypothetical protein
MFCALLNDLHVPARSALGVNVHTVHTVHTVHEQA